MASKGYVGSPDITTSTANQQLVGTETGMTMNYSFKKFSFINYADCHVKINGDTNAIFLKANQGFEAESERFPINSFVVVESGIQFQFAGAY